MEIHSEKNEMMDIFYRRSKEHGLKELQKQFLVTNKKVILEGLCN